MLIFQVHQSSRGTSAMQGGLEFSDILMRSCLISLHGKMRFARKRKSLRRWLSIHNIYRLFVETRLKKAEKLLQALRLIRFLSLFFRIDSYLMKGCATQLRLLNLAGNRLEESALR